MQHLKHLYKHKRIKEQLNNNILTTGNSNHNKHLEILWNELKEIMLQTMKINLENIKIE